MIEARQYLRALLLYTLQRVRVKTKCVQDGRCNLRGVDALAERALLELWVRRKAGDETVVAADATMLGHLWIRLGIDDT